MNSLHLILDTSFLLLLVESGRDILAIIEDKLREPIVPLVPDLVLAELRSLADRGGRRGRWAGLALEIAAKMQVLRVGEAGAVDEKMIELASRLGYPVATADSRLQKVLRRMGVKCVYVNRGLEVYVLV